MSNVRIVSTGDRPSLDCHTCRVNEHRGADAAPEHLQCGGKCLSKLPNRMGGMGPTPRRYFATLVPALVGSSHLEITTKIIAVLLFCTEAMGNA